MSRWIFCFKGDCIMGNLRDQMLADLQLRGITRRTQKTYLREVRNLARYFKKSPEELGESEIKEYLLHLLKERKVSEGTFRFYYSGLKFYAILSYCQKRHLHIYFYHKVDNRSYGKLPCLSGSCQFITENHQTFI
jgi:hypothetical protein